MQRFDRVTADQLQLGDRFYLDSDKGKTKKVFVKVPHKAKTTNYQTYKHFYCADQFAYSKHMEANAKAIEATTKVVFLRSSKLNLLNIG